MNVPSLEVQQPFRPAPLLDTILNCKSLIDQVVDSSSEHLLSRFYLFMESFRRKVLSARSKLQDKATPEERITEFDYPFIPRLAESRMPWYARYILNHADLSEIVSRRRENYAIAQRQLSSNERLILPFSDLPDDVCPWGFPVLLKNRGAIDYRFREQGVPLFTYGETLHSELKINSEKDAEMVKKAELLSSNLLCFGIHQDLTPQDIQSYCEVVNSMMGKV